MCHMTPTTPLSQMTCQQAGTCYLRPNLKFLPITKILKAVQNGEIGVTQGHRQSHRLIERMDLFDFNRNCASISYRFQNKPLICRKQPILTHPPASGSPAGVDPGRISRRSMASENQILRAIAWCCLSGPMFSRFSTTPTCDRQTDSHGQTDTRRANIASRGKNLPVYNQV